LSAERRQTVPLSGRATVGRRPDQRLLDVVRCRDKRAVAGAPPLLIALPDQMSVIPPDICPST